MNKAELIESLAKKLNLPKSSVGNIVGALLQEITDELSSGNSVVLAGFGTFEVRQRSAREGRNPRTGEPVQIPATLIPAFRPSKVLKDSVLALKE